MKIDKKTVGKRLRGIREGKNLKQNFVAEKLGIHNSTLNKYESGEREPDIETLNKLATLFDISIDYLLGRTDDQDSSLSVAFSHGGNELTADEEAHLEEELKRYRELKERFMTEKRRDEESNR